MCDSNEFDRWAESYDDDVIQSDQAASFPFAGYAQVLDRIAKLILEREPGDLLDIGTGSGTLAARIYEGGWNVTAVDFSEEMLKLARHRMPQATFIVSDFSSGIPRELVEKSFDIIIMTYAFHHLAYKKQPAFLRSLVPHLRANGKILIGDIAFETQSELDACHRRFPADWDDEEYYPILTEIQAQLPEFQVTFEVISFCAGIFQVFKSG